LNFYVLIGGSYLRREGRHDSTLLKEEIKEELK